MVSVKECSKRPILSPCELIGIDYQIDTYIGCEHYCHYCYALSQAETDWTKEILIHKDIDSQLTDEIENLPPQRIYMGYHTDPYQPCEAEHLQTRKVLELLLERGFSASILTKSDLILRDMDILKQMDDASVSVSVAFNDNRTRRLFEANTMDTEKRIDALGQIKNAGIRTGALVCPVVPHITEAVELIAMLQPHTDLIWIYGLSIHDPSAPSWVNLQGILDNHFPDLKEKIVKTVFYKDHNYWIQLRDRLTKLKQDHQLNLNIHV